LSGISQAKILCNPILDIIPDFSKLYQLFLMGARQFFRVWKRPVFAFLDARINGAVVIGFLVTDRDHIGEQLPGLEQVKCVNGTRLEISDPGSRW
jgi:hypothetical protein